MTKTGQIFDPVEKFILFKGEGSGSYNSIRNTEVNNIKYGICKYQPVMDAYVLFMKYCWLDNSAH